MLHNSRYCNFVLRLTEWLIQLEKRTGTVEKDISMLTFSDAVLTEVWSSLKATLSLEPKLTIDSLLKQKGVLAANLMTGFSLGNLFSTEKSVEYCYPWLDIYQGIQELSMLETIQELALSEEDNEAQIEYFKWVQRKQYSLLSAIEQSKQRAITNDMYWVELEH